MTTLREAAQQALEALEFMADEWGFTQKANRPERWQAITALRAALEQTEQEPVAWLRKNGFRFSADLEPQDDSELPLYTHPPRREPEQEPVARMLEQQQARRNSTGIGEWDRLLLFSRPAEDPFVPKLNITPLYTHPPRRESEQTFTSFIGGEHQQPLYPVTQPVAWRSLSEEEILPLYSMLPSSHAEMLEFARAIEAKLKERIMSEQPKALRLTDTPFALRDGRWNFDADDELRRLHVLNGELLEALKLAVRQNDYDMLMTGEELRDAAAAIKKAEGKV